MEWGIMPPRVRACDWTSTDDKSPCFLLVPRIKLTDRIEHCLSYFDEGGANAHCSPVPEGPHRDLATVTLRHFLGGQKLVVGHSRLLMTTTTQDGVQTSGPCGKKARVIRMCFRQITVVTRPFPQSRSRMTKTCSRSILMGRSAGT